MLIEGAVRMPKCVSLKRLNNLILNVTSVFQTFVKPPISSNRYLAFLCELDILDLTP